MDTKGVEGVVDVRITGPGGAPVASHVTQLQGGLFRAEYEPDVVGTYRVEVLHQVRSVTDRSVSIKSKPRRGSMCIQDQPPMTEASPWNFGFCEAPK